MMPLCTTTIRFLQSRCGCAFSSVGRPCVASGMAHRNATVGNGRPITSSSFDNFPALRRMSVAVLISATPAESPAYRACEDLQSGLKNGTRPDVADDAAHAGCPTLLAGRSALDPADVPLFARAHGEGAGGHASRIVARATYAPRPIVTGATAACRC